jgi:hypothetical protein
MCLGDYMELLEISDCLEFIANEFVLMDKNFIKDKLLKYSSMIEKYHDELKTALEKNRQYEQLILDNANKNI